MGNEGLLALGKALAVNGKVKSISLRGTDLAMHGHGRATMLGGIMFTLPVTFGGRGVSLTESLLSWQITASQVKASASYLKCCPPTFVSRLWMSEVVS